MEYDLRKVLGRRRSLAAALKISIIRINIHPGNPG
jgi:hypothetical protein